MHLSEPETRLRLRQGVRWLPRQNGKDEDERILEDVCSSRRFVISGQEVPIVDALIRGVTSTELEVLLRRLDLTSSSEYLSLYASEWLLEEPSTENLSKRIRAKYLSELTEALLMTVEYAGTNIPYYAESIGNSHLGRVPKDINEFLEHTPFLSRADYSAHFPDAFLPSGRSFVDVLSSCDCVSITTSGTSGLRIVILHKRDYLSRVFHSTYLYEDIFQQCHAIFGPPNCMSIRCGYEPLSFEERHQPGVLLMDGRWVMRQTPEQAVKQVEEMKRAGVSILIADPYYLAYTAYLAINHGAELPRLQAIYLTYAYAQTTTRSFLKKIFNCYVGDIYGMAEAGFQLMRSCALGRIHLNEEFFYFDFSSETQNSSRVSVTTAKNDFIPFIRYETKDLVQINQNNSKCSCGSPFAAIDYFDGRVDEIIRVNGTAIPLGQFDRSLGTFEGVIMYQLSIQPSQLTLRYLGYATEPDFEAKAQSKISNFFDQITIRVERNERLPLVTSEKFSPVVYFTH